MLLALSVIEESYPRELARVLGSSLNGVQQRNPNLGWRDGLLNSAVGRSGPASRFDNPPQRAAQPSHSRGHIYTVSVYPVSWVVQGVGVIVSFGDKATEDLYHGRKSKAAQRLPGDLVAVALRKLDMINAAEALQDLASPPGNRLEALRGDLKGHHSIRVNDQWRLVFRWSDGEAHGVSLVDYHS